MKKKSEERSSIVTHPKPLTLRCDYREDDFELWPRPSELQLSQLAAQLMRSEKTDPKQLVEDAWALYWESCRVIKQDYRKTKVFLDDEEAWRDADYEERIGEPLPVPKCYPVSFRDVELLLLPKLKGRTAERARIMRDFLVEDYVRSRERALSDEEGTRTEVFTPEQRERLREEDKEELDSLFGQLRAMSFDARYYSVFAAHFLDWHRRRDGFIKSMVRSNSAKQRWVARRKNKKDKTGARPNLTALKEILAPEKKPS